ncbi:serine hydrolase [Actinomadura latina]|uniref:Serine hydrolase n=1 Tax=Actinomadura latina TaxID=163603 RepID=A0A846ZAJ7_9ACTN|nr:serine hydrolase [Actinomadura latina]NKZ07423.1 serine hydrolase [Actinomadura latina]
MTRRPRIDDLTAIAVPERPALSPGGTQAVYVLRTCDTGADRNARALWRVDVPGGRPRRLTRGPSDTAPAWSPDGTRVAFLRAQDGPPQVWLLPADGGEPEPLTGLPLGAGAPVWSPDGTRIAFTAAVDPGGGGPVVADRLDYRADGLGLVGGVRRHLHVVDVATRRCRQVTEGDWHAGDPCWSPDGTRLAFAAATAPDADLTSRTPVHVIDVTKETASPRVAGLPEGFAGAVAWTPDGGSLLVAGMTGARVGHTALLRVPLDGGAPANLSAPLDRNVMTGGTAYPGASPQFGGDGRTVLFCVRDRGCTHVYSVPVEGEEPRPVVTGDGRIVSGMSVAGDTAVIVLGTPTSYGEIVAVDLTTGTETVLTEHGADAAAVPFVREEREFTISDGTVVQGWLVRDPDAAGPQPLLLDVHGGPHNAWNGAADDVRLYHQELAASGWTVLLLNPRGSDGYGERFWRAAEGAWGEADAADLLEPVDDLVAAGIADPDRLAVTGYSYGGFMTCYLTGRDGRFRAAIAGGAVTDLTSLGGTAHGGHGLSESELGGPFWTRPERYAAMSPLARVDRVTAPTLLLHGADDLGCPAGQAQQWHTALRERGVPARLVLYPGASHLFVMDGRPSHRIDYNRRVVEWAERYAGHGAGTAGPRRPPVDAGHWRRRLAALAARYRVPGASLGILRLRPGREDELAEAAYGVLNKDTGVETTTDSVFQIGSITKVWTATVVMQLVDEGLLDLDAPVIEVLPELRLADREAAKNVTMRHLLTHTSGIDGDVFTDTGRGDDCLERYTAVLADVAQNHPLGATWSYCNSGFSLAGRVIERLTGRTWDEAIRERIVEPLGLRRTITLPEEALLHRAAVGHVSADGSEPSRAPVWQLPRSIGPAGLIGASAADVLAFARMHLTGGRAPDGTRLLSEEGTAAMAARHAELPDTRTLGESWGLGWIRMTWDGRPVIGHGGSTIGQNAYLHVLPDEGLVVVLLTNGGDTEGLSEALNREVFTALAGVAPDPPLRPPAEPVAAGFERHLGTYERAGSRLEVLRGEDGPVLRTTATGPLASMLPDRVREYPMAAIEEDVFAVREPGTDNWMAVTFYALPTGERYLHFGLRATPKTG